MTKAKLFTRVLLAIALIVPFAGAAHAGAGSGTGLNFFVLDCYEIERSANSPYVVELTDQFGVHKNVKLGKGNLLCAPVSAATVESGPLINPNYVAGTGDHLKCYDADQPRGNRPAGAFQIDDPLVTETVRLNHLEVMCIEAIKTPLP